MSYYLRPKYQNNCTQKYVMSGGGYKIYVLHSRQRPEKNCEPLPLTG